MHEKATDDYGARFDDGELAEACVVDLIRCRVICKKAEAMLEIEEALEAGFEVRVADLPDGTVEVVDGDHGEVATLSLVRAKNKFAPGLLDPTRFRNILNNALLSRGGSAVFVELQAHHAEVYQHNEESHAHDHYDFLCARTGGDRMRVRTGAASADALRDRASRARMQCSPADLLS